MHFFPREIHPKLPKIRQDTILVYKKSINTYKVGPYQLLVELQPL